MITPQTNDQGVLVVVLDEPIDSIDGDELADLYATLVSANVVKSPEFVGRPLRTSVIAMAWAAPTTDRAATAQRHALESISGRVSQVVGLGIELRGLASSPQPWLDGQELVVAVAEQHPSRLHQVLDFDRDPSDRGWMIERMFTAATRQGDRQHALEIYRAVVGWSPPAHGNRYRRAWLKSLNNAIVQGAELGSFDIARELAERVDPYVRENPYLGHSAACICVHEGDLERALELCEQAARHDYEHLDKMRDDGDLNPLRQFPRFTELFERRRSTRPECP